jgi:hypothetical protein
VDFLNNCGLSDVGFTGRPAVRIPYFGPGGEELAVRFRIAHDGDCFRWKTGSKPLLYGLNRIADARNKRYMVLVEGESDVHTLWHHGTPAIGLPGATNWREDRDGWASTAMPAANSQKAAFAKCPWARTSRSSGLSSVVAIRASAN